MCLEVESVSGLAVCWISSGSLASSSSMIFSADLYMAKAVAPPSMTHTFLDTLTRDLPTSASVAVQRAASSSKQRRLMAAIYFLSVESDNGDFPTVSGGVAVHAPRCGGLW